MQSVTYGGNLFTAEEILRMRERDTYDQDTRLTIRALINSLGIHNLIWGLRTVAKEDSEKIGLLDDPADDQIREKWIADAVDFGLSELAREIALIATEEMN